MTLGALGGSVKPLSHAEILALPPAIRLADLAAAFGVSEPVIRRQHRSGELERLGIKVVKLGAQYRVVTSTVWAFLGIAPDGQAALRAVQPDGGPGGLRAVGGAHAAG